MAFNGLTDAEGERLDVIAEEAAEIGLAIGKTNRHGYGSYHPADPKQTTNRELLEMEVGHLLAAVDMAIQAGDLDVTRIAIARASKTTSYRQGKYLHHQQGVFV